MTPTPKKKLIEVALPLDAINEGAQEEKNPFLKGHPRSLHLWWARRPLAAARAVIFAQMVDDPSAHPDKFPTLAAQEVERLCLFRIIEQLVRWENTTNEDVLNQARDEIWKSWRSTCADNREDPRAAELFNPDKLPAFHDPFAGGGALPLEAQRLGLESYASDLNPVAVLINKAMIEIPPKFAGKPPVNPEARKEKRLLAQTWRGAQGLAEDARYYGQWMRDEAEKRIGHLYPKIEITPQMVAQRPDLRVYLGQKLTVTAWLWARTVKSPNPAFSEVDVPLVSTFMLSTKEGKEAYVEPVIEQGGYHFTVKTGKPKDPEKTKNGTSAGKRAAFRCLVSDTPISYDYIRMAGQAGKISEKLMAIVAEGLRGRIYLSPTSEIEAIAQSACPDDVPDTDLPKRALGFRIQEYGMTKWRDLFTRRQLVALTTFSDLVQEARVRIKADALAAGLPKDGLGLEAGGRGASAYADAVAVYLGCGISQLTRYLCTICAWNRTNENIAQAFGRQAIPMVWDYAEANPIDSALGIHVTVGWAASAIERHVAILNGTVFQIDAQKQSLSINKVVSTDPPYYDNIGYADLSDFFYVWLRRSLRSIFPDLYATLAVPKAEELVATPYRHGSKLMAEAFFLHGMTNAMRQLAQSAHPAFPVTIYYAFKQSESDGESGTTNSGWDTFLAAVIKSGFIISGTWPVRTEKTQGLKGEVNALASSIVLVCRARLADAPTATRREFLAALKAELPLALTHLQRGNIAPVDLAQAAIGPGMSIYTRYTRVVDAAGQPLSVREALTLINQTLDEALAEQEGDFDSDTRWALAWFEQFGFQDGPFGDAETLSKAKNTAINGLEQAGIILTRQGRVRLLRPSELPANWNPAADSRLTVWETVHHLVRVLETGGESGAAILLVQLGSQADAARELAYHLYTVCERRKRAAEALSYNALVQSWPEIARLAREGGPSQTVQTGLFGE